jgi:hypothetical protein
MALRAAAHPADMLNRLYRHVLGVHFGGGTQPQPAVRVLVE